MGQGQQEDLYKDLEMLAATIEKSLAATEGDLEFYRNCPQLLSELRSLMFELVQAKNKNTLLPLLKRFSELEGAVKEIRNDLSSRKVSRHS